MVDGVIDDRGQGYGYGYGLLDLDLSTEVKKFTPGSLAKIEDSSTGECNAMQIQGQNAVWGQGQGQVWESVIRSKGVPIFSVPYDIFTFTTYYTYIRS